MFLLMNIKTDVDIVEKFILIPSKIMEGEVWRLITYIFLPPTLSLIWIIFVLMFYYMIGTGLESTWGSFKYNIYYLIGMVGTTVAAFISGYGTDAMYLNLSLLLAFAYLYPNHEILLFMILPVKIKYLAYIDLVFLVFSFVSGDLSVKLAIVASLVNFLIFFGKDLKLWLKNKSRNYYRKDLYNPKRD